MSFKLTFLYFKIFRGSGNLINAITKAKKFGIIDHDGDEEEAYVRKLCLIKIMKTFVFFSFLVFFIVQSHK